MPLPPNYRSPPLVRATLVAHLSEVMREIRAAAGGQLAARTSQVANATSRWRTWLP